MNWGAVGCVVAGLALGLGNGVGLVQAGAGAVEWLTFGLGPVLGGAGAGALVWWRERTSLWRAKGGGSGEVLETVVLQGPGANELLAQLLACLQRDGRLVSFERCEKPAAVEVAEAVAPAGPVPEHWRLEVLPALTQVSAPGHRWRGVAGACLLAVCLAGCYRPVIQRDGGGEREPVSQSLSQVVRDAERAESRALARAAKQLASRTRNGDVESEAAQQREWSEAVESIARQKSEVIGPRFAARAKPGGTWERDASARAWDEIGAGYLGENGQ